MVQVLEAKEGGKNGVGVCPPPTNEDMAVLGFPPT